MVLVIFIQNKLVKTMQKFLNERVEWLRKNAANADKMTLCTHPIKISHPDAKGTSVLFEGNDESKISDKKKYLRSGTIKYQDDTWDCVGNASYIPIAKFLMYKMEDDRTVFAHFKDGTKLIRDALSYKNEQEFAEIRDKLLRIEKNNDELATDHRVKQVYFPVNHGSEYHLLSILSPTKIMLELKNRIKKINDENKKEAKNGREFIKTSRIVYGGANKQNISILNSKINQSLLLLSHSPIITERKVRLPKKDFVYQCITTKYIKEIFECLNTIFVDEKNNIDVREKRDDYLIQIIEYIAIKADSVKRHEFGWSGRDAYKNLPTYQKLWLDDVNQQQREEDDGWLDQVIQRITRVLVDYYNKHYGKNKIILGDEEYRYVIKLITEHKQVLYARDNIN